MPSELDDGVTLDRRGVPVPWEAKVACPVAGAEESGGDVHSSSDSSDSEDSSEADTAVDAEIQAPLPEGGTREPATLGGGMVAVRLRSPGKRSEMKRMLTTRVRMRTMQQTMLQSSNGSY